MRLLVILLLVTTAYADPIRDYKAPLVCKPKEVRGNVTYLSGSPDQWIVLSWKDVVSISKDKIVFRYKGKSVSVPMEGYSCLPKPYQLKKADK